MDTTYKTCEDSLRLAYIYLIEKNKDVLEPDLFLARLNLLIAFLIVRYVFNVVSKIFKSWSVGNMVYLVRSLPVIRHYVGKKIDSIGVELRQELLSVYQKEDFVSNLPKNSTSPDILLKKVKHYQMFDTHNWQQGRISGAIYTNNSSKLNDILLSVYGSYMWSNPLHSDVFAGVRKMEAEIVRMVSSMFHGDPKKTVGSVTSGGTESIIMAMKAYRDYAVKVRGIQGCPEIIAPVTAHAAFEKGANMLGCKIIHIPVDSKTFKVNVRKMRQAITKNTCVLVGSAPQFPHGIIDPIRQIAKLGVAYNIPVHVDACLGGFLIPFMRQAGYELDEDFDFTVPGVTSVSADTHKYGYAPKGTSVILYSDKEFLHQQYSVQTDWPGGIYASPTLPGSRPGALIATCWAAMMYHGLDGYVTATESIIKTTRWIKKELSNVAGLRILGDPQVSVISFASDKFDIYILNARLKDRGWNLNALQFPSAFHLCVTLMHCNGGSHTKFVGDVKEIVKDLMNEPSMKASGSAAMYGMAQALPDRSCVNEICTHYLDGCLGF